MTGSIDKARVLGSPHLGTYAVATDEVALVPRGAEEDFRRKVREVLSVSDIVETTVAGTSLIGIFVVAQGKTVIVPDIVREEEVDGLRGAGLRVEVLETSSFNALGNVVLHNSRFAVVHPELNRDLASRVAALLNVRGFASKTVGGIPTVGSAAVVTDRGGLVHPSAPDEDVKAFSELFGVEFDVGTVNFGIGFVRSGLVTNNYGTLVGELTTGPEIIRIARALRVGD